MKTVTLLRHAKSDWSDTVTRDFDRPLNGRGRRAARLMGEWAKAKNLRFDAIIASPAVRVKETLDHFLDGYGAPLDIHWDRRIYLASAATLLDVLHDQPDALGAILMVGHNPGLEDLVLDTVPEDGAAGAPGEGANALREAVEAKYPTASMATLSFESESWEAANRPARLTAFVRPRDLDPALGPDLHQH